MYTHAEEHDKLQHAQMAIYFRQLQTTFNFFLRLLQIIESENIKRKIGEKKK